jgi:ribonuclease HI
MSDTIITIYTDGSCSPVHKIGTWAAIIFNGAEKVILSGYEEETTQHRMEVRAIIEAVDHVKTGKLSARAISVFTDSQYAVRLARDRDEIEARAYQTKNGKSMRNEDLVRAFIAALDTISISWTKLKAHRSGGYDQGCNREADQLARRALRQHLKQRQ